MNKQELKKHAGLIEKYVLTEAEKLHAEVPSTCSKCAGGEEGCSCPSECPECHKMVCMCEEAAAGQPTSHSFTIKDLQEAFRAGYHEGLLATPPFTHVDQLIKQYISNKK